MPGTSSIVKHALRSEGRSFAAPVLKARGPTVQYISDIGEPRARCSTNSLLYFDNSASPMRYWLSTQSEFPVILIGLAPAPPHLRSPVEAGQVEHDFVIDLESDFRLEICRLRQFLAARGAAATAGLNNAERRQSQVQRVLRELGLPALSGAQVNWVRDKVAMKRQLSASGLRTSRCASLRSAMDVPVFARRVGWPVVVKPRDGMGSFETRVVAEGDVRTLRLDPDTAWMVEEYLPFREVACCAVIAAGGHIVAALPSVYNEPCIDQYREGHLVVNISTPWLGDEAGVDFVSMTQQVVDAFNLPAGTLHYELFLPPDRSAPYVNDVGFRLGGYEMATNHTFAHGWNLFRACAHVAFGWRVESPTHPRFCFGDIVLPAGLLRGAGAGAVADRLLQCPGVVGLDLYVDEKVGPMSGWEASGTAFVKATSTSAALAAVNRVRAAVQAQEED